MLDIGYALVRDGYACANSDFYLNDMIRAYKQRKGLWNMYFNYMTCICEIKNTNKEF